jgi:hypothetical protein
MKRRDALIALGASGIVVALPDCRGAPATSGGEALSEGQIDAMLKLNGMSLGPGEGPAVLASFVGNRFAAVPDPAIQPQCDFDPEVD